MLPILIKISDT